VPAALAKARPASRWQRGGSGADYQAFGRATALFNQAIRQAVENRAASNRAADASDSAVAAFDVCPACGSGAWTEQRAARSNEAPPSQQ
jgi:hypothetical protein